MLLIDGVNRVLRAIGEIAIPTGVDIDSLDPLHEAFQIRDIILEHSRDEQTSGWWFNEETWTFLPDGVTSKIGVPVIVLAIKGVSTVVLIRGNNLYDVANQTLLFEDAVDAETVFELDFEETPQTFAQYVVFQAAIEAQWLFKGDKLADDKLETKAGIAFIRLEKEHMSNKGYNLITGRRLIDRGTNPTPQGG